MPRRDTVEACERPRPRTRSTWKDQSTLMTGIFRRMSLIFRAKTDKALDKLEDPRQTLDYSYQRQLELLQKVRRGVADVATSRKRVELQANQLNTQADKLTQQAQKALEVGREDLAREALTRRSGIQQQLDRPAGSARAAAGRGGEADPREPAAPGQGRRLPHPQGDDQGHLFRRRGPDADQRGVLRHQRGDGRRRAGHPAGRGQDRTDAGSGRCHRRVARQRRPRRPDRDRQGRHHLGTGAAGLDLRRGERARPDEGLARSRNGRHRRPSRGSRRRRSTHNPAAAQQPAQGYQAPPAEGYPAPPTQDFQTPPAQGATQGDLR